MTTRAAISLIAALVLCTAVSLSAHKTVVSSFTYYQDIRPLMEKQCASCHDQRGLAPLLLRYDDAASAYPSIERALLAQDRVEHGGLLTHIEFDRIMTWAAGGTPEGSRPAGAPLPAPKRHAPHAGQLGGLMVLIVGDTLHAEAIWSEQRRFRVYVTTTTGELVPIEQLRSLMLFVSPGGGSQIPMSVAGDHLEARVPTVPLPGVFALTSRNGSGIETAQLQFSAYSVEPPEFTVPPTPIPSNDAAIVAAIGGHARVAREKLTSFRSGELYVPTTHIRDLLIALNADRPDRDRALRGMMRANWALHIAGDNGLSREIREAAEQFTAAHEALVAAYTK